MGVAVVTEVVPSDLTTEQPSTSKGRWTYDMTVQVSPGISLQDGVFSRIPLSVTTRTFANPVVVRLVLDVSE
jgi:hypothetical protein